jgi:Mrp family chromosome partitioning ATPase
MDTTSALGAIRRRWWLIVLFAALGAALAALPSTPDVEEQTVTHTFEATHTMLANNLESAYESRVSPSQVGLFATVGEVPQRVAAQVDFDGNVAELANQLDVQFNGSNGALTFTATADNAENAELIADTFAEETNVYLLERQASDYEQQLSNSNERLATLEGELDDLTALLGVSPDDPAFKAQRDAISRQYSVAFEQSRNLAQATPVLGFTTLQTAKAIEISSVHGGTSRAPTSRFARSMMGLVVGIAVGIAIALLLARIDRKLRTQAQAEEVLGMRARVSIPKVTDDNRGGIVTIPGRHDPLSDSYRTLRNVVGFVQGGLPEPGRASIVLVVSPGPGDGKTSMAANLAAAFVETGEATVVVNTDYRRPRLAKAVRDVPAPPHPFDYRDLERVKPASLLVGTDVAGLQMLDLSSIDAGPGDLVRAVARLIPSLATTTDQIVIDTSPVGATAEVLDLVAHADIIVIAARIGQTSIESAARSAAILRDLSSAPIILALTGTKPSQSGYYEYSDRRRKKAQARAEASDDTEEIPDEQPATDDGDAGRERPDDRDDGPDGGRDDEDGRERALQRLRRLG